MRRASSFTAVRLQQSVDGPEDLAWARVAVVSSAFGEDLLGAQGLQPRPYLFVIQACKALLRGEIDAVVYNKAILDYMIKDYGWKDLAVLPHTLLSEDYAIVLPDWQRAARIGESCPAAGHLQSCLENNSTALHQCG
jgi:polar amino acid transport system substrate-binding protein